MLKKIITLCLFLVIPFSQASEEQLRRMIEAQANLLNQYQQQMIELQSEIDQLRGDVQRNAHQINLLMKQNEANTENNANSAQVIRQGNNDVLPNTPPVMTTQTNDKNTLVNWTPTNNDKTDYNHIIKFVLADKERDESIAAFKKFIDVYPKSTYLGNANFWIGQILYKQGKKDDAAYYFAIVVKQYPNSGKAGMSLAKIGQILEDKKEKSKAKAVYQQVISQYSKQTDAVNFAQNRLKRL